MRVPDALKVCPNIKLVHVETVGSNTPTVTEEHQDQETFDRLTQKACLERYRAASYEILALLHKIMPNTTIEKASIDEFYMDVTADIQELLHQQAESGGMWGSIVVGHHHNTNNIANSESGVRLGCAARIACQLRGAILEQLGTYHHILRLNASCIPHCLFSFRLHPHRPPFLSLTISPPHPPPPTHQFRFHLLCWYCR